MVKLGLWELQQAILSLDQLKDSNYIILIEVLPNMPITFHRNVIQNLERNRA
jgi:hypothetical protein